MATNERILDLQEKIRVLVKKNGAKVFNSNNLPLYKFYHKIASLSSERAKSSDEIPDGKSTSKTQDRIRQAIKRGSFYQLQRPLETVFPGVDFTLPIGKFIKCVDQISKSGFLPARNLCEFVKSNSDTATLFTSDEPSSDEVNNSGMPNVALSIYRKGEKGLHADMPAFKPEKPIQLNIHLWEAGYLALLVLHPSGETSWLYPSAFNIAPSDTQTIQRDSSLVHISKRISKATITVPHKDAQETMEVPNIAGGYELVALISQIPMDGNPIFTEMKIGAAFNQDDVLSLDNEAAIMLFIQECGRDQVSMKRNKFLVYH